MRNWSVRTRLMVWNVLAVAALTILLGLGVSWRVRADLTANVDRELRDRAVRRIGFFGPGPGPQGPPDGGRGPGGRGLGGRGQGAGEPGPFGPGERRGPGPPGMQDLSGTGFIQLPPSPFRPRVFDSNLKSVTQFSEEIPWDVEAAKQALSGRSSQLTTVRAEGEEQRILTMRLPEGGPPRVLQYAHPMSETERAITGVNHTLFGMLPFALFLAGLGGYYLTERALRPVAGIARAAGRVSGENLSERLPATGKDEFAQLSETINSMLDRLQSAFQRLAESVEKEKRFTGDAAHELRSPLTAIKANTSLALSSDRSPVEYREALSEIDRSATRMAELVDDLLVLARSDAGGAPSAFADVPLMGVIEEAAGQAQRRPRIEIHPGAETIRSHRSALVRLFSNLLDNAYRHTPEDGEVSLVAWSEPGRIEVEVRDSGEGISSEHLSHLGERFYRVDSARARSAGGVGLGLSICRSIIEAHGGTMRFESEVGKGTTVRLSFPHGSDPASIG